MTAEPPQAQPPRGPGAPVPPLPFALLGLMTLVTFVGPFAIVLAVRGGPRPEWPPDRPVEWWTFGVVTGLVIVLMAACLSVRLWSRPR